MAANTEMARFGALPITKLNEILNMEGVPPVTGSANGKVLTVSGGKWKAADPKLTNDKDVSISSPTGGQILTYDSSASKWKNGSLALAHASDVALSTPSNGQVLTYDGEAGKWKNADAPSGGALADLIIHATLTEEYDELTEETTYVVTADYTPEEVGSALNDGASAVMVLAYPDNRRTYILSCTPNLRFRLLVPDFLSTPPWLQEIMVYVPEDDWAYSDLGVDLPTQST